MPKTDTMTPTMTLTKKEFIIVISGQFDTLALFLERFVVYGHGETDHVQRVFLGHGILDCRFSLKSPIESFVQREELEGGYSEKNHWTIFQQV